MVWDSDKASGDVIASQDWDDQVTVIKKNASVANMDSRTITAGNHVVLERLNLLAGTTIKVHASAINPSGTTGLNVVVRNVTDASDIYSNNSETNIGPDLASGGDGDVVEIRVDNSSGSEQNSVSGSLHYEFSSV